MASDIAVIGLGVMGRNLALNLADRGYRVAVYNRSRDRVDDMLRHVEAGQQVAAMADLSALRDELTAPRKVLLMLTAGPAVDSVIEQLSAVLQPGDVIMDAGNSNFHDSQRRWSECREQGLLFLGVGVSGGEEGARHGPSIMPGGDPEAWPLVQPMLQAIAARTEDGEVCCQWVGEGGAGHYVKMIHNGIEYGDMQLIAEAWQLMGQFGLSEQQVVDSFRRWNDGVLQSYLIEITAEILRQRDPDDHLRVHAIEDSAGQKGTGRWTAVDSLELGAPLTLIAEAVYARMLSAFREQRIAAARYRVEPQPFAGDAETALNDLHDALYAARIISYAQGFMQMRMAAEEYGWTLEYGNIALLWRAGCIIRSRFLKDIKAAFDREPGLENLMQDEFFRDALLRAQAGWRNTCVNAIGQAVAMPAMSSALAFYDAYHTHTLPANLIQAQRDYFGAHTYRRVDRPPGQSFHTHWSDDGTEEAVDG